MPNNVLIAFYSRIGSTEALANGIAEVARFQGRRVTQVAAALKAAELTRTKG